MTNLRDRMNTIYETTYRARGHEIMEALGMKTDSDEPWALIKLATKEANIKAIREYTVTVTNEIAEAYKSGEITVDEMLRQLDKVSLFREAMHAPFKTEIQSNFKSDPEQGWGTK